MTQSPFLIMPFVPSLRPPSLRPPSLCPPSPILSGPGLSGLRRGDAPGCAGDAPPVPLLPPPHSPSRLEARWRLDARGRLYCAWVPVSSGRAAGPSIAEAGLSEAVRTAARTAARRRPSPLWSLVAACASTLLSVVLATSVLFMLHGWRLAGPDPCSPGPCSAPHEAWLE